MRARPERPSVVPGPYEDLTITTFMRQRALTGFWRA